MKTENIGLSKSIKMGWWLMSKHTFINKIPHPKKMQIYNEFHSGSYHYTDLAKKHKLSVYMVKQVINEINDLIRYKIYGEPPKQPKVCNICGGKVKFNRCDREKSRSGFVYYCTNCYAWVSTSPKYPRQALGELANKDMRKRRYDLHQWFDKLWSNKKEREYYYDKLAIVLGKSECHFSQMTMEELDKAEKIVKKWWLEKYDI